MLSRRPRPHGPAEPAASGSAAAPASDSGAVLDPAALARMAELDPTGSNRLIERVLEAFQTSAARLQPQAEAARASGDRAALRFVAHTLKSSSASIGAMRLSRLCAEIEAAIRADSGDDLSAPLDAMSAALAATLEAIARQLKDCR